MNRPFIALIMACFISLIGSPERGYTMKVESVDFDLSEDEAVIVFFNLSDGEATLVKDGHNHHLLINTGSERSKHELFHLMNTFGVKKVDDIIVTKPGPGFDDNLNEVVTRYSPNRVYVPAEYKKRSDVLYKSWKEGTNHRYSKEISVRVLHHEGTTPSMDILVTYGENRILYMTNGDLITEKKLSQLPLSDTDVLKVANYGIGSTTSQPFLEKVDPQAAIIFESSTGRIETDLLERLYEMWIDIHYVKQTGTVAMKMTKYQYEMISIPSHS
ncbi:hypothetical protein [Bacillus sp. CGMCC 1.16541]|uniref:hypothetical protein n=1 Tax=Bacillus sp. CGMCC 1.16541 TaxID=2185143 RepID=UPI000D726E67|nr:hypothetical protein [Bacillus sp. CGMCC 1.16541]